MNHSQEVIRSEKSTKSYFLNINCIRRETSSQDTKLTTEMHLKQAGAELCQAQVKLKAVVYNGVKVHVGIVVEL